MSRKRPINVEVYPKHRDEPLERMIKRFVKKLKKEKILEKVRDNKFYEKPSIVRRKKAKQRKRTLDKLAKKKK
jgi:small subunit ribosomal protein S21